MEATTRRRIGRIQKHLTAGGSATEDIDLDAVYHHGELAVQKKSGRARDGAFMGMVMKRYKAEIPKDREVLVQNQNIVFCSSMDSDGMPWASLAYNYLDNDMNSSSLLHTSRMEKKSVFLHLPKKNFGFYDSQHLYQNGPLAILAIDYNRRLRFRLQGTATILDKNRLELKMNETFPNCSAYIPKMNVTPPNSNGNNNNNNDTRSMNNNNQIIADTYTKLNAENIKNVHSTFSFFLATRGPFKKKVDISHRGGRPGFIRVLDQGKELLWPDYPGNVSQIKFYSPKPINKMSSLTQHSFFIHYVPQGALMSMGNIEATKVAGLLLPFNENGSILQIVGTVSNRFDKGNCVDGADREVHMKIKKVVITRNASPKYDLHELSSFTPTPGTSNNTNNHNETIKEFLSSKKSMTIGEGRTIKSGKNGVRTFILDNNGKYEINYTPGQYVQMVLKTLDNIELTRSFTITDSPLMLSPSYTNSRLEITVKRDDQNGLASKLLFDNPDMIGAEVEVIAVDGNFTLKEANGRTKLLFLSAGIGITPFVSMLKGLAVLTKVGIEKNAYDIQHIHSYRVMPSSSNPNETIIPFQKELDAIAKTSMLWNENVSTAFNISYATTSGDGKGRITKNMIKKICPDVTDRFIYVCGPKSYIERCYEILIDQLGINGINLLSESFDA